MGWINSIINLLSQLFGFSNKIIDVSKDIRKDRQPVIEERAKKDSIDISQKIEVDIIKHEAEIEEAKFKTAKKKSHWRNKMEQWKKKHKDDSI